MTGSIVDYVWMLAAEDSREHAVLAGSVKPHVRFVRAACTKVLAPDHATPVSVPSGNVCVFCLSATGNAIRTPGISKRDGAPG